MHNRTTEINYEINIDVAASECEIDQRHEGIYLYRRVIQLHGTSTHSVG